MKHTKGPWKIVGGEIKSGNRAIATLWAKKKAGECKANAILIAAAPETKQQRDELLDIMISIERYTHSDASPEIVLDLIRESAKGIIAKATT